MNASKIHVRATDAVQLQSSSGAMPKAVVPVLAVLLIAALGICGFFGLFTSFQRWDDEGYILYTLKNFWQHHPLYREVCSPYGPAYYLVHSAVLQLFGPPTTDLLRFTTLGFWVLGSLASGVLVFLRTRDFRVSALAILCSFQLAARAVQSEPTHPQTM
ncbi:MAG: hypothetical protein ACREJM_04595, partial [Candidatus Saccharimonadales bacterium]